MNVKAILSDFVDGSCGHNTPRLSCNCLQRPVIKTKKRKIKKITTITSNNMS